MILNRLFCGGANTTLPGFTYTGNYTVVDDGDAGWRIKFLTSGTLTLHSKRNIDVFCVGGGSSGAYSRANTSGVNYGGGSGGAGGYTKTSKNIQALAGKAYTITIGAGGAAVGGGTTPSNGKAGNSTSAFGVTASGGVPISIQYSSTLTSFEPGNGGSGGGYGTAEDDGAHPGCSGGSDGSNGYIWDSAKNSQKIITGNVYGYGQGSSTREFGESGRTLYSGGGGSGGCRYNNKVYNPGSGGSGGGGRGAGYNSNAGNGTANTGGGGGGGYYSATTSYRHASGAGGSGIVVIRNHR